MMKNKKSQAFFADFTISMFIFTIALILYFSHISDLTNQEESQVDDMILDAKIVSDSLVSEGYPADWDITSVKRVGFTDGEYKLNSEKYGNFYNLGYNRSKKLLGINYDYFLHFINESDDVQNVEGYCGVGFELVNTSYILRSAYYYKGAGEEEYLKAFMVQKFNADIYRGDGTENVDDFDEFLARINNYDFIVIESPELTASEFNNLEPVLDPWVLNGGFLMLGGQTLSAQGGDLTGITLYKISGTSESDRLTTVVNEDIYFDFSYGDNIIFTQAYYIEDDTIGAALVDIARFNESESEIEQIKFNKIALARWPYGTGNVFFMSDYDADYLSGDFLGTVEEFTKKWVGAECRPINISNIERNELVKVERYMTYKKDILKMILYLWR